MSRLSSLFQTSFFFVSDVFSNCHPLVLGLIARLGADFRVRSKEEIRLALEAGVEPGRMILDSDTLVNSHLRFAAEKSVSSVAFRTSGELVKIKKQHPKARYGILKA